MTLIVFNAGSSSIKFAVFDSALNRRFSGQASEIGGSGQLQIGPEAHAVHFSDHAAAIEAILGGLADRGLWLGDMDAAAHRIVHGGRDLTAPCRLTPKVLARVEAAVPLAPLHNPHNLSVIRAVARAAPALPQFATFDTAFHATNPEVALRYAIPASEDARGIRRYGFHGISYSGLVRRLPSISGEPLPRRLLALHLGNGASLCAILEGRSVATTMGYSPLDGLTMGTRAGGIDGNAALRLAAEHGVEGAARILNFESGLLGLGGYSDMRALRAQTTPEAAFAIEHFRYWTVRHAGSMIAAMGGLDAIAFTGGIGENDAEMRAGIMAALAWTGLGFDAGANSTGASKLHRDSSAIGAWIVSADEERTIAENARSCLLDDGVR